MFVLARDIAEQPDLKSQDSELHAKRMAGLDEACRKAEDPVEEMVRRVFLAYVVLEVRKSGSDVFTGPVTGVRVIECVQPLLVAVFEYPDLFMSLAAEGEP